MYILGISPTLNASAVLMKDNEVIFAIQEERLSRMKNHAGFPLLSIKEALAFAGISSKDIDHVAVGGMTSKVPASRESDLRKFHNRYSRIRQQCFGIKEKSDFSIEKVFNLFASLGTSNAKKEKDLNDFLKELGIQDKTTRFDHHLCHAASAYYGLSSADKNEEYLVFSMDGGGDGKTSAVYKGKNNKLELIAQSDSFSPACLYAHITYIMGFMPHEHEYKLMGLAPYASPKYSKAVYDMLSNFIGFSPNNPLVFNNGKYTDVSNSKGHGKQELIKDLFIATSNVRFDNLASGLQMLAEDVAVKWIKAGVAATGIKKVLLTGGFFMNVKANKLIAALPEVEFVNCFPSCGDETNAFGAAFLAWNKFKKEGAPDIKFGPFCLGSNASDDIEEAKKKYADKVDFRVSDKINEDVADMLIQRKIVARCSGRMEFGARALGNRSIIAAPDDMRIINIINAAIKKRDFWMPFAPAMIREKAEMLVKIPPANQKAGSPYMMFTFDAIQGESEKFMAGIHQADKTARSQLVTKEIYPEFHDLITKFYEKTGIPSVLNTSFNLHGYPIVKGACDAVDVYLNSALDVLIVDNVIITRKNS